MCAHEIWSFHAQLYVELSLPVPILLIISPLSYLLYCLLCSHRFDLFMTNCILNLFLPVPNLFDCYPTLLHVLLSVCVPNRWDLFIWPILCWTWFYQFLVCWLMPHYCECCIGSYVPMSCGPFVINSTLNLVCQFLFCLKIAHCCVCMLSCVEWSDVNSWLRWSFALDPVCLLFLFLF